MSFVLSKSRRTFVVALLSGLLIVQLLGLGVWWLAWSQGQPTILPLVVPLDEADDWGGVIAAFEAENPDIRLELVQGSYDTDQVKAIYSADLSTGTPQHDLIYMDVIWTPWFASEGWLHDLSDQFSPLELDGFLASELSAGRYQGGLYRMPFRADVGLLLYDTSLLERVDDAPPDDLADLVRDARAVQRQNATSWGYLWQGREYEGLVTNFVEVLYGYGGFWIDSDTQEVGLDQEAAIAAANFLASTIQQEISPPFVTSYSETESFNQFVAGESLFLRSWTYFWQKANRNDSPLQGKVGVASIVAAANQTARACRGGWGFGLAQNAAHPEEAKRAISFLTSATAQRDFVLASGHLPSRVALFEDAEILEKYPFFPDVLEDLEQNSVFRPQIPQYDQVSRILQSHLWQMLTEQTTPEAAMQAAATETRQLLAGN